MADKELPRSLSKKESLKKQDSKKNSLDGRSSTEGRTSIGGKDEPLKEQKSAASVTAEPATNGTSHALDTITEPVETTAPPEPEPAAPPAEPAEAATPAEPAEPEAVPAASAVPAETAAPAEAAKPAENGSSAEAEPNPDEGLKAASAGDDTDEQPTPPPKPGYASGGAGSPAPRSTDAAAAKEPATPFAAEHAAATTATAGTPQHGEEEDKQTGDEILSQPSSGKVLELKARLSTPPPAPGPIHPVTALPTAGPSVVSGAAAVARFASPAGSSKALMQARVNKEKLSNTALSDFDKQNTANVSQLLKLGSFKRKPLVDFVPFDELVKLRLEDGIDATRKEDYLDDAAFEQALGMSREAFKKLPAWKQQQAKKKANLF